MRFIKMINRLGKMLDRFSVTFFKRNDASKFEYIIEYDNGWTKNAEEKLLSILDDMFGCESEEEKAQLV